MSLEDFANSAAQLGVLTPDETIDIFLHFTAHSKPMLSFPTRARTGLKPQVKSLKLKKIQSSSHSSHHILTDFSLSRFVTGFSLVHTEAISGATGADVTQFNSV